MNIQSLSNLNWQLRQSGTEKWLPTKVPGCVHTTLLKYGMIPDPFVEDNEKKVQWVAKCDWEYQVTFEADTNLLKNTSVLLICDGLDTLAEVKLNGITVGEANDMFIQYSWDVKHLLKPGENVLNIFFHSPVKYAEAQYAIRPLPGVSQAIPGGNYLRKAPCQFGWDWGPQLPPIGIWKDIKLIGFHAAKFEDIKINQIHHDKNVTLEILPKIRKFAETPLTITAELLCPDNQILSSNITLSQNNNSKKLRINIENPQLWYPNGYGEQPLYQLKVMIQNQGEIEDSREYQIGLRTLELVQEKDEWGRSFKFVVNGIPIFAKGSNWIPADSFPTRITKESLEHLLKSAADSHQNMLRVWGGGFYESDLFYDLCDRLGILIWQDFIFSCSVYPLNDPQFLETVKTEIYQNVSRLRHHPSLALWCGNNEMEWGWESWGWSRPELKDMQKAYDFFFHQTLPNWINDLDPYTSYWPSSPSSNTPFYNVNGEEQGDSHYWEVWHGRKPFTAYREHYPRFMSEFGFQSLPPLPTIKTYAKPEDWNMTSYIMEHHQKNSSGNGLIIAQMTDSFRMPKDFSSLVYLSMVLQAEGIRYGVEHWRRNKHRVSGTLYWQLNDCWPVASWSSLDYYGRWKALHYHAKNFYAPLLLSLKEEDQSIAIFVTSDLTFTVETMIRWRLIDLDGKVLDFGETTCELASLESRRIVDKKYQLADEEKRKTVFVSELIYQDSPMMQKMVTFVPNKHLALKSPAIEWNITEDQGAMVINLRADTLARFVELSLENKDVIFTDNYFDLYPGMEKRISILSKPEPTIQEVAQNLVIRSLYDSFA